MGRFSHAEDSSDDARKLLSILDFACLQRNSSFGPETPSQRSLSDELCGICLQSKSKEQIDFLISAILVDDADKRRRESANGKIPRIDAPLHRETFECIHHVGDLDSSGTSHSACVA